MLTIEQHIQDLETVKYQIAELKIIQEKIEARVIQLADRGEFNESGELIAITHEGEKTTIQGKFKLTIRTDYLYAIDKGEYEVYMNTLPDQYNPVRTKVSYDIDKRLLREAEKYASHDEMIVLGKIITKKLAKPAVKFTLNV